jgi:hypothetical protein
MEIQAVHRIKTRKQKMEVMRGEFLRLTSEASA